MEYLHSFLWEIVEVKQIRKVLLQSIAMQGDNLDFCSSELSSFNANLCDFTPSYKLFNVKKSRIQINNTSPMVDFIEVKVHAGCNINQPEMDNQQAF